MASHLSSRHAIAGQTLQIGNRSIRRSVAADAPQALFGRKAAVAEPPAKAGKQSKQTTKTVDKAADYDKRRGLFGNVVSSLDFAETRSKSDAELLWEAKYGKRGADGKMTREQYAALRRRIGGTKKDFWKTSIDVNGEYTDKGWVDKSDRSGLSSSTPIAIGLGVLVLGLLGYVVVALE